jgi:hypothetical protein
MAQPTVDLEICHSTPEAAIRWIPSSEMLPAVERFELPLAATPSEEPPVAARAQEAAALAPKLQPTSSYLQTQTAMPLPRSTALLLGSFS